MSEISEFISLKRVLLQGVCKLTYVFLQGPVPFGESLEGFFKVGSRDYFKVHRACLVWCDGEVSLLVSFLPAPILCRFCWSNPILGVFWCYYENRILSLLLSYS